MPNAFQIKSMITDNEKKAKQDKNKKQKQKTRENKT